MTDNTELIHSLRHGYPSALRLLAADALDAAQAEVKHLNLHLKATQSGRDAALARLAEIEAHHKEVLSDLDIRINYAESRKPTLEQFESWWRSSKYMQVVFSEQNTRQVALDGWNAAAGASPQQSPLLQFCTCEDCKPMECEGCRINRERRELLPAPGDAAREYMNGYSDGREWAGATNQAQPSQAVEPTEAQLVTGVKAMRLFVKAMRLFVKAMRLFVTKNSIKDFRDGFIAAINAKEQPNDTATRSL